MHVLIRTPPPSQQPSQFAWSRSGLEHVPISREQHATNTSPLAQHALWQGKFCQLGPCEKQRETTGTVKDQGSTRWLVPRGGPSHTVQPTRLATAERACQFAMPSHPFLFDLNPLVLQLGCNLRSPFGKSPSDVDDELTYLFPWESLGADIRNVHCPRNF